MHRHQSAARLLSSLRPAIVLALGIVSTAAVAHALPELAPANEATTLHAGRYHLQTRFWVALHQTLLQAAQQGNVPNPGRDEGERTAWDRAIGDYRDRFGKHNPVFNEELIAINDELMTLADDGALPADLKDIANTLRAAATIYRSRQWANDLLASRFWTAVAGAMLDEAGAELVADHERVYGAKYPDRIVVDVSPYGGEFGAYTTMRQGLVHTTVSTRDPAYQGYWGLEMMLHEASHTIVGGSDDAEIGREINAAARALGRRPPPGLWHAVLFYTSGELTRRALARRGIQYRPFILEMYTKTFGNFRQPLESEWQAYLDGRLSRDEAIRRLVAATTTAAKPPEAGANDHPTPPP